MGENFRNRTEFIVGNIRIICIFFDKTTIAYLAARRLGNKNITKNP